ncbi:hypothetical protein Hypma_000188, partial [Hypsizygus marmoreus]
FPRGLFTCFLCDKVVSKNVHLRFQIVFAPQNSVAPAVLVSS